MAKFRVLDCKGKAAGFFNHSIDAADVDGAKKMVRACFVDAISDDEILRVIGIKIERVDEAGMHLERSSNDVLGAPKRHRNRLAPRA